MESVGTALEIVAFISIFAGLLYRGIYEFSKSRKEGKSNKYDDAED